VGLENPTWDEWRDWYRAMLAERESAIAGVDLSAYTDDRTAWSDLCFRQMFLFMYDESLYDRDARRYRTAELVERWRSRFGRVDSVLLWHAYPRLGFDTRTQFDFYRDMPGGFAQLRREVCDVLHARGIRVFIDYNPWDRGSYDELGQVVASLDADGVMLDTMTAVPEALVVAVSRQRSGVVFAPELRPADADLSRVRQSWAQWFEVGDADTPSIYRHRWLVPRHMQLAIRRWDTSRKQDIVYSFFNGCGLILWDNVFGTWNPYSREDRRLIAETAAVFDGYQELFVDGDWMPLVPTGVPGVDANRWNESAASAGRRPPHRANRAILTLRNRTAERVRVPVPADAPPGMSYFAFWGDVRELSAGDEVAIEPGGVQALVLDDPAAARHALARFSRQSSCADVDLPGYDERCPRPRALSAAGGSAAPTGRARGGAMIELPGGTFDMRVRHDRRECGCYPFGASDDAVWGWFYKDTVTHELRVSLRSFAMRATAVTNAEYLEFVHAAGYRPRDDENFLRHIARSKDGSLPREISDEQGALPVTFVSLADARAFAAWNAQRLPTEAEWQWAATGAGRQNRFPWGDVERSFPPEVRAAFDEATATPQGVTGLSGNTWELTESEYADGHSRFVMLRGGVFLPPGESEWLVARGVRPNDSHAKYLLLSDGLDRSEAVSFRTVADVA
jgi:formylglycine-generating enzyme required for sulfatase activity